MQRTSSLRLTARGHKLCLPKSGYESYSTRHGRVRINLQPDEKVIKLEEERNSSRRLDNLELEISELKSAFLLNEGTSLHKIEKKRSRARLEPASWSPQGAY